jgi:predicted O-methyltransferase YrrM
VAEPSLRTFLSTGSLRNRVRWAIRIFTPWGIEWILWKRSREKARRRLLAGSTLAPNAARVEESIRFLVDRGLDAVHVRDGSMPAQSLDYLAAKILDRLPSDRPLHALQIGNFVGVSLAYLTWLVGERHPESLVVSIDPNLPYLEVEDPQSHALALLAHFKMLDRSLIINGYTLERGDEVLTEQAYARSAACENVLGSLDALLGPRFDLVVIDGNHDEDYLAREIAAIRGLLADGGIVVFDDITDWPGVAAVFKRVSGDDRFVRLGDDGRIGILQLQPPDRRSRSD